MQRPTKTNFAAGSQLHQRAGLNVEPTRLLGLPQNRRLGLLLIIFALSATPVMACPMCKDSTVDSCKVAASESASLDFNKSIYIMLGGFASVVGLTGRVMYKAARSSV
jgi:hypothetical protein